VGWKESARKALVGEKVELKATGGECFVRPKKLPTEVTDEIRGLRLSMIEVDGNAERVRHYQAVVKAAKDAGREISEDEAASLMGAMPKVPTAMRASIYRLHLVHGIGEHNFTNDEGALIGAGGAFDVATVDAILQWDDLASEISAAVEAWNSPLPQKPAETSST
jgi:hypothetical protein